MTMLNTAYGAGCGLIGQQGPASGLWIGLILMVVVFFVMTWSGNRKEQQKRRSMLSTLKKGDRVMTIGGVIGSVAGVSDNEVTVKVDESANVKITVVRGAIQRVLTSDEKPRDLT